MEDCDGVLGEDGADDDGLLERAVALLAQWDEEPLEERARLEQGLADRLEKRMYEHPFIRNPNLVKIS